MFIKKLKYLIFLFLTKYFGTFYYVGIINTNMYLLNNTNIR